MNLFPRFLGVLAAGVFLASFAGCSQGGSHVLGQEPGELSATLGSVRQKPEGHPMTVRGIMVEKCPEAGCWFVLKDATGKLRVDTKTAGFVVVDVPLQRELTVVGTVITNGTEVLFAATGVRY